MKMAESTVKKEKTLLAIITITESPLAMIINSLIKDADIEELKIDINASIRITAKLVLDYILVFTGRVS